MKIAFLLLVFALFVACSNDQDDAPCATTDPTNDLEWLKEAVATMEADTSELAKYFFIEQATYNGEVVFVFSNCCPNCNTVVNVFNCQGELLGQLYDEVPYEQIRNPTVIYKRADSPCP